MLDALKFAMGAVARKDYVPSLTHFRIAGNKIYGFNGRITICSPIALDLVASPKAVPFVRAIETCREEVTLGLTPTGRLSVRSGAFKANIECLEDGFTPVQPDGTFIELNGSLLGALKVLIAFTGEDASRPWAMGILFKENSAFATNNVCLIQYWLGYQFPQELNIPQATVRELLRIGEEPRYLQVCKDSVTFWYDQDKWLNTCLYDTGWPDLAQVLDRENAAKPIIPQLFEAINDLVPFIEDSKALYFLPDEVTTSLTEGQGASVDLLGGPRDGKYHISQLQLLEGVATHVDWDLYPKPCLFFGEQVRGAIIGMRK